ncbi:hypothetical protein MMC16_006545 [Acarospora aff. strigata]|nr:hypothetical protein [Acarospora aff. strigata]
MHKKQSQSQGQSQLCPSVPSTAAAAAPPPRPINPWFGGAGPIPDWAKGPGSRKVTSRNTLARGQIAVPGCVRCPVNGCVKVPGRSTCARCTALGYRVAECVDSQTATSLGRDSILRPRRRDPTGRYRVATPARAKAGGNDSLKDKAAEKRDGGGAEERVGPSSEPEGENSTSATESTVCEEGMTGTGNAVAGNPPQESAAPQREQTPVMEELGNGGEDHVPTDKDRTIKELEAKLEHLDREIELKELVLRRSVLRAELASLQRTTIPRVTSASRLKAKDSGSQVEGEKEGW